MTILHDGTGQQNREGYRPLCKQGDKDQVRTRFRNDAYEHGNQQNQEKIALNPLADIQVSIQIVYRQQGAEGPEKDPCQMLLDQSDFFSVRAAMIPGSVR